jgi:hypothetical protein
MAHDVAVGTHQHQVPVAAPLPPVIDRIGLAVDDVKFCSRAYLMLPRT